MKILQTVQSMFKSTGKSLAKHSPEVLTGLAIVGMFTGAILAIKVTPKANEEIKDISDKKEKVVTTCKYYAAPFGVMALSAGCMIFATRENLRRNAALAAAFKISETALTEFHEKAVETLGEKKTNEIKDKVIKDKVDKHDISKEYIIDTGKGKTLCFDTLCGRYFWSDADKIRQIVNLLNVDINKGEEISLNDFYYEQGLPPISSDLGDYLVWDLDYGLIDIYFSSHLTSNDEPVLAMEYRVGPMWR